ncbi:MAG: pilus assembly FimT family protein, partial [Roseateles sp.]
LSDFMERRRVIAAAGELSNLIAFAKSEANVIGAGVTVHVEDDPNKRMSCAALVTHALVDRCKCFNPPAQICPTNGSARLLRLYQLPNDKGVTFKATASAWSGLNQAFSFIRKNRVQSERDVTLTVTGKRTGAQLVVSINDAGLAKTCSPVGRVGGFPTC